MITSFQSMTLVSHTSEELAEILDETNWATDFSWPQICEISKHMHVYKARKPPGEARPYEGTGQQLLDMIKGMGDTTGRGVL